MNGIAQELERSKQGGEFMTRLNPNELAMLGGVLLGIVFAIGLIYWFVTDIDKRIEIVKEEVDCSKIVESPEKYLPINKSVDEKLEYCEEWNSKIRHSYLNSLIFGKYMVIFMPLILSVTSLLTIIFPMFVEKKDQKVPEGHCKCGHELSKHGDIICRGDINCMCERGRNQ